MSKKLAEGVDALVLDVKVGNGAFMKKQVDARRLAQTMVAIGRRMDKKVRALITDMNQPLGYAIGNALEIMEASQTLQNAGPDDLTQALAGARRPHDLTWARRPTPWKRRAARPSSHLVDGSAYKKFKQVVAAQGGNAQALDKFELLPNATGMREITSPRAGYVTSIDADDIGIASNMIGAGRDKKDDPIDPAVGIILEVKIRRESGCRLGAVPPVLHQGRPRGRSRRHGGRRLPHLLAEARRAQPDSGGGRSLMGRFTGLLGLVVILGAAWLFSSHKRAIKLRIIALGPRTAVRLRPPGAQDRFRQAVPGHRLGRERHAGLHRGGQRVRLRRTAGHAATVPSAWSSPSRCCRSSSSSRRSSRSCTTSASCSGSCAAWPSGCRR